MEAKKVVDTLFKYLEKNMVPGMSNLQEIAFYAVREGLDDELSAMIETARNNLFSRAVLAISKDGDVDFEKLAQRVKRGIEHKGALEMNVPLYGPVRFMPEDIDNILSDLREVECNENNQNYGRTY